MKTSDEGIALIKRFEGYRDKAYPDDGRGIWTIGFGHTKGVKEGDTCTEAQADGFLREDIKTAESAVTMYVPGSLLTQAQFDALVSFTYNVGVGNFVQSRLLANVKQGRLELASRQFPKWITAGGKVLPGLVKRRQAEAALFRRDFPRHDEDPAA